MIVSPVHGAIIVNYQYISVVLVQNFIVLVSPVHGAIKVNYQCSLSGVGANIIVNIFS